MTERKSFNRPGRPRRKPRLFGALQRGATRRDMLAMLMAGGMQADAGRQPRDRWPARRMRRRRARAAASGSPAQPPRRNDTLDPAKQSNHTDYSAASCSTTA